MNKRPLIYLASPYTTDDAALLEKRVETIEAITAELIDIFGEAVSFFSPIAHTHRIEKLCKTEPDWVRIDTVVLERCDYMIVVTIEGWQDSIGIQREIEFCKEHDIPYTCAYNEIAKIIQSVLLIKEAQCQIQQRRKHQQELGNQNPKPS